MRLSFQKDLRGEMTLHGKVSEQFSFENAGFAKAACQVLQEQNQIGNQRGSSSASALHSTNDAILPALVCHFAARGNIDELASVFLDQGGGGAVGGKQPNDRKEETTSPGVSDCDGRTGLHLAASCGQMLTVRFFLDLGARVDVTDNFGRAPLREAVEHGHSDAVLVLREKGASLGASHDFAASTLYSLAQDGNKGKIEQWIKGGIDVQAKDYDGRTALHVAVACGEHDIARMLIAHGADEGALDRWGNSPGVSAQNGGE